jgi:hypothetical protein
MYAPFLFALRALIRKKISAQSSSLEAVICTKTGRGRLQYI